MHSLLLLATSLLPALASATPYYRNDTGSKPSNPQQRAAAVKEAFKFAWDGYEEYAFPNDELLPVNNSFFNSRNGWGATAVDALSTAILMELPDIVTTIIEYIPSIDYSVSEDDQVVSLFETTIRYLGGMLSGYDLLTGPYQNLASGHTDDVNALLKQSTNLANNLAFAFDTPTGIPANLLYFGNCSFNQSQPNSLATIGTLVLEWTRLSDLTGDTTYTELTQKAEEYLLNPISTFGEPFPGLFGTFVNISTGRFLNERGGWGGGVDSFYEYLIKMFVYDSSRFSLYGDRWVVAADSTIENLASHPSSRPDLTFISNFNGTTLTLVSSHLACFDGGNFILGGLVLGEQKYIDFGLELVSGCHEVYTSTLTGIGPEIFSWNVTKALDDHEVEFYNRAGFYIIEGSYSLRPEVLESFYYAYRATGDPKYQEWSWNGFVAVNSTTRIGSGFSSIADVNANSSGKDYYINFQESFLFAELFKYAYLIQADDVEVQVEKSASQKWVLNTEGHPVKVFGHLG